LFVQTEKKEERMTMAFSKGVVRGSVAVFYLLIGLEIIIMVSPFAAYFYAAYGPLLNWLYSFSATAWLTSFFLPHAIVSKSALLNFVNSFGHTLFSFGIIAFLIGAVQIYSAKFRRKGVVAGFLYRWIRHPQYLFLAVAGLGLMLFWPRFFILVLYITMLFVYYLLARHEEQRMLAQRAESYQAYMQRTAMFIPGEPGGKIFRALFGRMQSRGLALTLAYVSALALGVVVGFSLRSYTISQTAMVYVPDKKIAAISILPWSEQSLREILDIASQDSAVTAALEDFQQQGHKGLLVHIMPQHYMMQGLFIKSGMSNPRPEWGRALRNLLSFVFPFLRRHSHHEMNCTMECPVRLIFSQLTWPDGEYAPFDRALAFTVKHLPLLRVDIDTTGQTAMIIERTSLRNYWGQMPMPAF
jgi:protein-S-isoprenylcysteine O-methyltransferase Ste14